MTTTQAPSPFAVVDRDQLADTGEGQAFLADLDASGVQIVTRAEMRFLKEWSWGPDAHVETCEECGERMVFEKHPADWPSHPGDPNVRNPDGSPTHVRVGIECPRCGHRQYTDGITEKDYKSALTAELTRQIGDEVAVRLSAEAGRPVEVVPVEAGDTGGANDEAAAGGE